jgi:thiamine biosynthesis protein ThiS
MQITLNGTTHLLKKSPVTVTELLAELHIDVTQIAVEKNLAIIPKSQYHSTEIHSGDAIELVEFVGGG